MPATCLIQMCVPNGNLDKAREKQADTPERRGLLKFLIHSTKRPKEVPGGGMKCGDGTLRKGLLFRKYY